MTPPESIVRLGLAMTLLVLPGCTFEPNDPRTPGCESHALTTGRPLRRSVDVNGITRRFLLDVPSTLVPGETVPVLFDFHGWGHSADGVWNVSRFRGFAPDERFITIYPDGLPVSLMGRPPRPGWEIEAIEDNRDIAFTDAMLGLLNEEYCVDKSRIYSTGFSNGAYFSHVLACARPNVFAAIAPVGGGRITVPCEPERPIPVMFHHGSLDQIVPIASAHAARDAWIAMNDCKAAPTTRGTCTHHEACAGGADVVFCEENAAHSWPQPATRRIWEFLAKHELAP